MGDRLVKLADGLFARYYPSGKRALQVQFFYRGARCRETFKGLDPDVKAHVRIATHRAGAILEAIRLDTFNYVETFPTSRRAKLFGFGDGTTTFKDVGDTWLADMKRSLPHSTYRSYQRPLENFAYPTLGKLKIRNVTPEHIRDLFRDADITLKTARNYRIPLLGVFRRAVDDGHLTTNPMDRVTLKMLIPAAKHRSGYEPDPLAETEITAFLKACREHRPKWTPYWTIAFYTGLRTSELYGLEWPDLRGEQLDIVRAIVEGKEKGPKTESGRRTLQLVPMAVSAFAAQRQETGARPRIFWNPNTRENLFDYDATQACFDYVCKKAGLRRRNQYQTRHSYASNLLVQGENLMYVAKQLGHADLHMLLRVYAKWMSGATYTPRSAFGKGQVIE